MKRCRYRYGGGVRCGRGAEVVHRRCRGTERQVQVQCRYRGADRGAEVQRCRAGAEQEVQIWRC